MIWNPWKRIRQLEAENARMADRLDYEMEETDRRIGNAIVAHYRRIQHEERYRDAMIAAQSERMADIASMMPFPVTVMRDKAGEDSNG